MKEYLEYKDYKSQKFWEIQVIGNQFTVLYGKIGTDGREQVKTFDSEEKALKEAKKLVTQKIDKGYQRKLEPSATEYKIGAKVDASKSYKFFQDYDVTDGTVLEQLASFITQENCDKVTKIVIGMWGEYDSGPDEALDFIIANKEKFKAVKHFYIGDIESEENEMSWIIQTGYEKFLKEFSNIEKLELRGGNELVLGKFNLPNLKQLRIETGGMSNELLEEIIASIQHSKNLTHLELWLGTEEYGGTVKAETVEKLISGMDLPKLKFLGLMNSDIQDLIVKLFENHPIIDKIETLDFSMGVLTNKGGKSLLANDKLSTLKSLRCVFNFMSDDMIEKLTNKFKNGDFDRSWAEYEEEEDEEDRYYYVEVGE